MKQKTLAAADNRRGLLFLLARQFDNLRFSRQMLIDVISMIDVILVIVAAILIRYIFQWHSSDYGLLPPINYLSVIALVTATLYASLRWRNHYDYGEFEDWSVGRGGFRLGITVLFSFGFSLFVVFMLKESAEFSRAWVFTWCASSFIILFASRLFWIAQFRSRTAQGFFRRRVLLLGTGHILECAREDILSMQSHCELVGVCEFFGDSEPSQAIQLVAALNQAVSKSQSGRVDELVIALPGADSTLLDSIIRRLRFLPVDLKVALDFGKYKSKFLELGHIGSTNVLSIKKKPISEWNIFLKAVEDYTIATFSLIIFLPAMAVIALLIKLDSKGPVFFRQRRHGSNHKIIEVYKFRTMSVLEDGDTIRQASKDDKRVTRVGRYLRMTSLDELPQLLNVLAGNMSLVGPRPHALAHDDHYSELLEDYASRHRVKPGITGWAQINGFRGEITEPGLMEQRVRYDLEYIDNWSIWFDIKVLLLTPLFGFISRKAY